MHFMSQAFRRVGLIDHVWNDDLILNYLTFLSTLRLSCVQFVVTYTT